MIEESVSIQEAPAFQKNIFDYKNGCTRGAGMYDQLCREIMRRIVIQRKSEWSISVFMQYFAKSQYIQIFLKTM